MAWIRDDLEVGGFWLSREDWDGAPWHITFYDGETRQTRRRSARTGDLIHAQQKLVTYATRSTHGERLEASLDEWRLVAAAMVARMESGSRKRGLICEVTVDDVMSLLTAAGFRCTATGLPLTPTVGTGMSDPWAPSIDRLRNAEGYVLGNIRVVCLAANMAMNKWGYDALLRLSQAVVLKHFGRLDVEWWAVQGSNLRPSPCE